MLFGNADTTASVMKGDYPNMKTNFKKALAEACVAYTYYFGINL